VHSQFVAAVQALSANASARAIAGPSEVLSIFPMRALYV
jgi:hypothetical protein